MHLSEHYDLSEYMLYLMFGISSQAEMTRAKRIIFFEFQTWMTKCNLTTIFDYGMFGILLITKAQYEIFVLFKFSIVGAQRK